MHDKPGGLCTSWEREDFTISTTGWVWGSGPANNGFHRFWQELGALQGREFVYYEEYARIEGRDGQIFILYTDIDRLEQHMLELAPEDREVIAEFISFLRVFTTFRMPVETPPEVAGPPQPQAMPPFLQKWMGMSLRDFSNLFSNPFMREAIGEGLPNVVFFDPDVMLMMLVSPLASMHLKACGYPVGGSMKFVRAIERRYLDLGGKIYYESPVTEILVENNEAVGVRLVDGTEIESDIVISAADGHTTIFDMLGGAYVNDEIHGYYDGLPLYPPILYISLGVNRSFDHVPVSVGGEVYPLAEPITIAKREWNWLAPHMYTYDPSRAPQGKTLVRVMLASDYKFWRDLKKFDPRRYKSEQEEIEDQVITLLDRRYPGFADQVEMCDVATPVSFERYTGNWQGSYLGWLTTPETGAMHMSKTLPGLTDLYMVGTWVMEGSLSMAATSGRHVTQIICHKDGRPFVTTVP
jgi:phytoene dehydrogenase-like protein